jgi:tetratricopeptide (TPR) repeat protein
MRRALEIVRADLDQPPAGRIRRWLPAAAAIVVIASVAAWFASRRDSQVTLAENDTIVLADVANATSDRVYGEALTTALRVSLEQTPHLNVLAEPKIRAMLGEIAVAPDATLSEAVVLQLCRHTGSKVVVAAAIADAGNRLRLELKAIDCVSGGTASLVRREASRNEVVAALGSAALQLRTELGEPAASLASYNAALEEATSSSPDALELLTLGYRRQLASDHPDAISYYQRAVQTDPNLALAHAALSNAYGNLGVTRAAAAAGRAAFALRDRMTAPTRFDVESTYHRLDNGDWEASCAVLTR